MLEKKSTTQDIELQGNQSYQLKCDAVEYCKNFHAEKLKMMQIVTLY